MSMCINFLKRQLSPYYNLSINDFLFTKTSTKETSDTLNVKRPAHVVRVDRGLHFPAATYDEKGDCKFSPVIRLRVYCTVHIYICFRAHSKGTCFGITLGLRG